MSEPPNSRIPPPDPTSPLRSIEAEITSLESMTAAELCARYADEFGKVPRSRNRLWLLRTLAYRVQENRLGGMSMVARRRLDALMAEVELPGEPQRRSSAPGDPQRPPQDRCVGPLTRPAGLCAADGPRRLRTGTLITKTWHGQELRLTVRDDGFELDGKVHRSLSAAAKAVTGAHWNGRLFWLGRTQ